MMNQLKNKQKHIVLILFSIFMIYPVFWWLGASLKSIEEMILSAGSMPEKINKAAEARAIYGLYLPKISISTYVPANKISAFVIIPHKNIFITKQWSFE